MTGIPRRGMLLASGGIAAGALTGGLTPAKADSRKPKRVVPIAAPPAAAAAGYTDLVFEDDFVDADSIDLSGTGVPGHRWYRDLPWGYASLPASDFTVANSVLTINQSDYNANWALCTTSPTNHVGQTFRFGYFEAAMRFNPSYATTCEGCPAFWLESTAFLEQPQPTGHWAELDIFEAYKDGLDAWNRNFYGTLHDWQNAPTTVSYHNFYSNQSSIASADTTQWHRYGALWQPGHVTWYFDGNPILEQKYSADGVPDPAPYGTQTPIPAGVFDFTDTDPRGLSLILGSGKGWPLDIDWVRVWR